VYPDVERVDILCLPIDYPYDCVERPPKCNESITAFIHTIGIF
jgi:hypothetical protein